MPTLYIAEFETPVGTLRAASSEQGLAYLELPHANGRGLAGWRERHASEMSIRPGFVPNRRVAVQVVAYLEGKRTQFDLPLDLRGTDFQRAVYAQVAEIPYGETESYGEVARRLGRPRAVRAVGAANGANPIPLVIPCHRVIASSGHLHGYGGGLELKARLLAMEGAHAGNGRLL